MDEVTLVFSKIRRLSLVGSRGEILGLWAREQTEVERNLN